MNKIGFIGMGNMAAAMAAGFIKNGKIDGANLYAFAPHQDKLKKNAEAIGFTPCADMETMLAAVDGPKGDEAYSALILACKPYQIEDILKKYREKLSGRALISIAAGWDYEKFAARTKADTRIQCVMPNTPSLVGEGVLLFEETNSLNGREREDILTLFSVLGRVEEMPSHLMGIAGVLTGCGPAFIDLVIEALGDAGVKYGLPRDTAYELTEQMILGSAKLASETGEHPGVLKDRVCSPAGTTIRGVGALEKAGLRAAFLDAVDSIMQG